MNKLFVLMFVLSLFACGNKGSHPFKGDVSNNKRKLMTEDEMVSFFEKNKKDFELLSCWMLEDKINHIPLFMSEKENGVKFKISEERENAYNKLIDKLSIEMIVYGSSRMSEPVVFYMSEVEENNEKINQGYAYRKNTQFGNSDWIETNDDLLNATKQSPLNTFVTKPINENWSLLILRQ